MAETEKISRLIIEIGGVDYELDGGGGSGPLPPDSVGTEQIIDGAVETEDLNENVIEKMTHSYDSQNEGIKIGGFVSNAQTAPTVPTQPMNVEEEEEP